LKSKLFAIVVENNNDHNNNNNSSSNNNNNNNNTEQQLRAETTAKKTIPITPCLTLNSFCSSQTSPWYKNETNGHVFNEAYLDDDAHDSAL